MNNLLGPALLYRSIIIVVLLAITIGLILIRPSRNVNQKRDRVLEISVFVDSMDLGIDTLYNHFGIESKNIRKREVSIADLGIQRREHRVYVPADFISILFNQRLNLMAERFGGKAYGSENSKTKNVTIHTRLGKFITHSIVIQPAREAVKKSIRTKNRK